MASTSSMADDSRSMERIMQEMERILECSICHNELREPKILLCGHMFCKECLEEYTASELTKKEANQPCKIKKTTEQGFWIECPDCRKSNRVAREVDKQPTVFAIKSISDYLQSIPQRDPNVDVCNKHPGNLNEFVCQKCKVVICAKCAIFEHHNHGESRPVTLNELKTYINEFTKQCNEWESKQKDYENKIQTLQSTGLMNLDEESRKSREAFQTLCYLIVNLQNHLYGKSNQTKYEFQQRIKGILAEHHASISDVLNYANDVRESAKRGRPDDLIQAFHTISTKRLKTELDKSSPSIENIQKQLDDITKTANSEVKFITTLKDETFKRISHLVTPDIASTFLKPPGGKLLSRGISAGPSNRLKINQGISSAPLGNPYFSSGKAFIGATTSALPVGGNVSNAGTLTSASLRSKTSNQTQSKTPGTSSASGSIGGNVEPGTSSSSSGNPSNSTRRIPSMKRARSNSSSSESA